MIKPAFLQAVEEAFVRKSGSHLVWLVFVCSFVLGTAGQTV